MLIRPPHYEVENLNFSWTTSERRSSYTVARCEIKDGETAVDGVGSSTLTPQAMRIATAEAWERFKGIRAHSPESGETEESSVGYQVDGDLQIQTETGRAVKIPPSLSSNGFASGSTVMDAARRAALELFERYCVLSVWNFSAPAVALTPPVASPFAWWVQFDLQTHRNQGWQFDWYHFGELGRFVTIACLARHRVYGAVFDSTAGSSLKDCQLKTTRSVLRMIEHTLENRSSQNWSDAVPLSQLHYYLDPERLCAFHFFDRFKARQPKNFTDRFPVQVVPIHVADIFPAVARAFSPEVPELVWGPASHSLCPLNPYPHPIA